MNVSNFWKIWIVLSVTFLGSKSVDGNNVTAEKSVMSTMFGTFYKILNLSHMYRRFPMNYPLESPDALATNTSSRTSTFHQQLLDLLKYHGVSQQCRLDVLHVNIGLENQEDWAVRMVDAMGKPNSGLVDAYFGWFGSYDECVNIHATGYRPEINETTVSIATSTTQSEEDTYTIPSQHNYGSYNIQGRYCRIFQPVPDSLIPISSRYRDSGLFRPLVSVRTCLPSTCGETDVRGIYRAVASQIGSDVMVLVECTTSKRISTEGLIVLVIVGTLGLILTAGTTYDIFVKRLKYLSNSKQHGVEGHSFHLNEKRDLTDANGVKETDKHVGGELVKQTNIHELDGRLQQFLLCFSIIRRTAEIFNIRESKTRIDAIEGIRVISMAWIILIHTLLYGSFVAVNVVMYYGFNTDDWTFFVLLQPYCVDTFFVISGFLVAYLCMKKLEKVGSIRRFPWGLFYLLRFWRIIPTLYLLFFINWKVYPHLNSGPNWPADDSDRRSKVHTCQKLWWPTLLFFNNFYGKDVTECYAPTWFLAADTQFYVLSPLLVIARYLYPRIAMTIAGVIIALTSIAVGVIMKIYEYVPIISAAPVRGKDNMYMAWMHYYPLAHTGPYLIGMLTGYLLYKRRNSFNISKIKNIIGWIVCIALVCIVVYSPYRATLETRTMKYNVMSSIYMALSRPLWACAISWMIISCATGNGGFINTLLSWKPYIVFGRLTFCAYLIHSTVIRFYFESRRTPLWRSDIEMAYNAVAFFFLSYALGFVVSVCVERPMFALRSLVFKDMTL